MDRFYEFYNSKFVIRYNIPKYHLIKRKYEIMFIRQITNKAQKSNLWIRKGRHGVNIKTKTILVLIIYLS